MSRLGGLATLIRTDPYDHTGISLLISILLRDGGYYICLQLFHKYLQDQKKEYFRIP